MKSQRVVFNLSRLQSPLNTFPIVHSVPPNLALSLYITSIHLVCSPPQHDLQCTTHPDTNTTLTQDILSPRAVYVPTELRQYDPRHH